MMGSSEEATDVLDRKPSKLNAESMRNISSDVQLLSDKKHDSPSAFKSKVVKHYDFFTGKNESRKVLVPAKILEDKSLYVKLSEKKVHGFGRSQGIC